MANSSASDAPQAKSQGEGSLLAVIGDEVRAESPACARIEAANSGTEDPRRLQDTVTGFLLAGVGNIDLRKNKNFLVVTDSECMPDAAIWVTVYEHSLFFLPAETPIRQVEDTLKDYTNREDIAIVLINQHVSGSQHLMLVHRVKARASQGELACR